MKQLLQMRHEEGHGEVDGIAQQREHREQDIAGEVIPMKMPQIQLCRKVAGTENDPKQPEVA